MVKRNSNTLAMSCEELTQKRPWCWERLKAGREGENRGWDGWMVSSIQWTWVSVSFGSWWWTRKPVMLQSMGLQRVRHDWATELNWTELNKPPRIKSKEQHSVNSLEAPLKVGAYLFVENLQLWLFHRLWIHLLQLFSSPYVPSGLGKMAPFIKCLDLLSKLQYFYFFPFCTINSVGNYRKGGLSGILFSTHFWAPVYVW